MSDEFAPKKAVKSQVKLKLGIQGPSGSGKTEGALALAINLLRLIKPDGRILGIDTENESMSLYADRYEFDTIVLRSPYTPARYIQAMKVGLGYDMVIVDSITHEWSGEGGIMSQKDALDAKGGNGFTNWATLTPQHEEFVEFIKQFPVDTIVTMRTKQSYVLEANNKGKQVPKKLGMAPIQREGMEYEYTMVFDVTMEHAAKLSKDRTGLFAGVSVDLMNPATAQSIHDWRQNGAAYVERPYVEPKKPAPVPASGNRAKMPLMITEGDRLFFWKTAQDSGYTNDQIKTYLQTTLKIENSKMIPAASFGTIIDWAHTPAGPQTFAPGEEKARAAAKILNLTERDIQDELTEAKGDWEAVYASINSNVDAEAAAAEATK